jgi:hypothetical protein
MNKTQLDEIIKISYKDCGCLDQKKVNKIVSLISNSDLKKYINGLKLSEKKKSLLVLSPVDNLNLKKFEAIFPNKKIVFIKDSTLMLGMKIIDNDIVYEFTLKNSLDKILNYMEQNYD